MAYSTPPLVRTYCREQAKDPPATESFHGLPQVYVSVLPAIHDLWEKPRANAPFDFSRIHHAGHLMEQFGGWLIILLTVQMVAAWIHGVLASAALGGPIVLHSALFLAGTALLNLAAWHRYRGRLAPSFRRAGLVLFAFAVLPLLILRLFIG